MGTLEARNLSFAYCDKNGREDVLHNINLSIAEGEFVCLIGHSGCGKSTLLKLMAGLLFPTSGTIEENGVPIKGPSPSRMIVFQKYSIFPWMKVRKNVAYGMMHSASSPGKKQAYEIADAYLEKVGMAAYADRYPYQLSGGMQQRVAIARALAMDTDILLLDEPFGALDTRMRTELQELLYSLHADSDRPRTIAFVTHDIDEALMISDRIAFMREGHIESTFVNELPRPRTLTSLQQSDAYLAMKRGLIDLFYEDASVAEKGAGR